MALTTLDRIAEDLAPTRATTNYFDPGAGQSVMSRYANAGRRVADSELAAEAGSRLLASRDNRLARQRNQTRMDREDEEYEDYKGFKLERSRFIDTIGSINPEAEDFETQLSEIYKTLPSAAAQDPLVMDLLESKKRVANDFLNERQAQARRDEDHANRLELLKERYNRDPRLSVLSPEEREKYYDPQTGEFDAVAAGMAAHEKARQQKITDAVDIARQKQAIKVEMTPDKDLTPDLRALKTKAMEHTKGDAVAFPDQVDVIRQRISTANPKKTGKDLEELVKKDPEYAKAKDYESNKFAAELESARNVAIEEYVAKGGTGLTDVAKEKRREVWRAANPGGQQAPAAPAPASPPTLKAGDKVRGYVFKGGDPADKNNWTKE